MNRFVWIVIGCLWVGLCHGAGPSESKNRAPMLDEGPSRVVHFPKDVSLGRLDVRDRGATRWQDWTAWGGARGDVTVPAGKELRLSIGDAFAHRSHLSSLGPNDIQELRLSSRELADADLDSIRGLTGLESLSLGGTYAGPCPFTGRGLANLQDMTKLRSLMLDFTSVTDDQLAHLAKLKSLESVSLHRDKQLTGDGLVHLKGLTSLRELKFYSTPVDDRVLEHIKRLTSLEVLSLQSTRVTSAGLSRLAGLKHLKELFLPRQIGDEGLAHLRGLTALERLLLYSEDITDAGLGHLQDLPALRSLTLLSAKVTRNGVESLRAARPGLEIRVSLRCRTDAQMAALAQIPCVTSLSLGRSEVTDAGLAHVAGLTSLGSLNLSYTKVTDAGLAALEGLRAIGNLNLNGTQIGDEGLAHLKHLTAMDTLRLYNTRVTDAGLAHLRGMKSLDMLFLNGTGVTDAGLAHLADLNELSVLFLGRTKITGPGVAHLAGLKSLCHLDLSGTPLTDAAVEPLKRMSHLQILAINTAGMSGAAVQQLRKALPDCTVRMSKSSN